MTLDDGAPFGPVVNGTMVVVFWEYRPSNVAAYFFLALFALATLGHLVYFVFLRPWSFIPFLLGGVCQIFGYLNRALAHTSPSSLDPWLLQNMLLLVSPPLLAATLYLSYGRISSALLHGISSNRRKGKDRGCCYRCCCACSPTRAYVLADVVAIFTQLIGTVLPASGTEEGQRLSKVIVLVGLLVQLIALGVFLAQCVRLHVRLRRDKGLSRAMVIEEGVNWLGYFVVMEVAAGMMVVRSVVRGVELLQGPQGVVGRNEVFVYVFDAVPMLVVMVVFLVLHPERVVREVRGLEGKMRDAEGDFAELGGWARASRLPLDG